MPFRRIALVFTLAALVAAVGVVLPGATAAPSAPTQTPRWVKGIYDEPETLYGNPDRTFPILARLRARALRVNLYWGGKFGVANQRPIRWGDPDEPAYDWRIYDRLALYAAQYRIRIIFSIYGTPRWANGGRGLNVPPTNMLDLQRFAQVAASRYSGKYVNNDGRRLPPVRTWLAWNEPNNPVFLRQQFKRVGRRWVIQSARDYAKMCNAIVRGVANADIRIPFMREGQRVACGVTAPRGNNNPRSSRPSVSPLVFMRAMKAAGARGFDAYAHHPYYGRPSEGPTKAPPSARGAAATAITLGNIGVMIRELTRVFGRTPLWITEYGYQTNPPDRFFGVSNFLQALYLRQAYAIAKRNPRIDMFLWFLLRDEPRIKNGWQSGFITASGARKPSFNAFRALR